ncbi:unnamed protein product [Ectocarpus sp. CCAP 1310/34]|nr:unnamed protein product [Ectocarpus sp. CCAP 1310/34]
MEGKFEQTFTNIFVMFKKYVSLLEDQANKRIKGGGLELEVVEKLDRVLVELGRLAKMERAVWDEMLSTELMARCNVGRPNKGGRPAAVTGAPDKVWGSISVKTQRKCMHPGCKSKTSKGCACAELCVGKQAGDRLMSTELMARCNVGRPNKGGRPAAVTGAPDKVWGSISVKTQRKCMHPGCKSKTSKGCACAELCVGKQAGDRGVLMCQACFKNPVRHARAGDAQRNPQKYGVVGRKDLVWWS